MDIFNIQSLIAKRRIVNTADIDPANSYIQLGVYQPNLRKKGGAENAYPAYAISLEDVIAASQVCNNPLPFKKGSVGEKVSFKKQNYADPYASRDIIIPGVLEITRSYNQGIYNIALESSYTNNVSPENTEWNNQYVDAANTSWSPLWSLSTRIYTNWNNSTQTPEGSHAPPQQVGMSVVMHETTSDRYWLIMFTEWTPGSNGGGFAYDRYEIFPGIYFEKPDYQTQTVDKISDGVWLARNDNGPLYNAVSETESIVGVSPFNTRWNSVYTDSRSGYSGFTDLSNLESRVYTDFALALDYNVGNNILSTDLIMHDLTTDLYYKFVFDSWTSGNNGGGFAYTRTVIPQNCSIKFADGTSTTVGGSASGGSSGPVVDANGNVIVGDSSSYTVNVGPGGTQDIPDFSGMLLVNDHFNGGVEMWLCGGGMSTVLVSSTPYGPGNGDVTINGGVNGYTWTNTNNQVGPFTFTVIKTRNGS